MVADLDREVADDPDAVEEGTVTEGDPAARADIEHGAQVCRRTRPSRTPTGSSLR